MGDSQEEERDVATVQSEDFVTQAAASRLIGCSRFKVALLVASGSIRKQKTPARARLNADDVRRIAGLRKSVPPELLNHG